MTKVDIIVGILAVIGLGGVVWLMAADKSADTAILIPIVTTLIGFLVGKKRDEIVGLVRKK